MWAGARALGALGFFPRDSFLDKLAIWAIKGFLAAKLTLPNLKGKWIVKAVRLALEPPTRRIG